VKHKLALTITQSENGSTAGTSVSNSSYEAGTTAASIDQVYSVVTDQAVAVAWTLAGLQSIVLLSDKNMTVKINDDGSPDATISLVAGVPFIWNRSGSYYAYPFGSSASVSSLYITTTAASRLQALILEA
jgi:hypothetical protein